MAEQIILTLPPGVYHRVEAIARRSGRPMGELIADTIEMTFSPLDDCSNEEVLAATTVTMPDTDDRRLSELLGRQSEGELKPGERGEWADLMGLYERLLVRKAKALQEAVKRGLHEPLAS